MFSCARCFYVDEEKENIFNGIKQVKNVIYKLRSFKVETVLITMQAHAMKEIFSVLLVLSVLLGKHDHRFYLSFLNFMQTRKIFNPE